MITAPKCFSLPVMGDAPEKISDEQHKAGTAAREAAWKKEWDHQFTLLPPHKQDAILEDPMDGAADELDEIVENVLCERGEL